MTDEKQPTEAEAFFKSLKAELTGTPEETPTAPDADAQLAAIAKALAEDGFIAKGIGQVAMLTERVETLATALDGTLDRVNKLEGGTAMKKSVDGDDLTDADGKTAPVKKAGPSLADTVMYAAKHPNTGHAITLTG